MPSMHRLIQDMVNYSAISRRDGALALEQKLGGIDDPFIVKALQMAVDGQSQEAIESSLFNEIHYLQERHQDGKKMLEFMYYCEGLKNFTLVLSYICGQVNYTVKRFKIFYIIFLVY